MFNTLPYNYFPASTAKFEEGKNDAIQAEIDAIKDGTNIDSFGDVETALSLKVNSADMETALATKTNLSNIASTFDSESGTYDIGEQIIYEGVLYEFISAHDTPGDWDSTEVQAVKISELIDTLNSNLTSKQDATDNNLTTTNKTIVGGINELKSGLTDINGTVILSEYKGKSLADQATANGSVGTITKSGYYMVMFTIEHTGANAISGNDPYWEVCLKNSNDAQVQPLTSYPTIMAIPIAKTWDNYMSGVAVYYLEAGTYYLTTVNHTGASTDGMYDSSVRAYAIYLHS